MLNLLEYLKFNNLIKFEIQQLFTNYAHAQNPEQNDERQTKSPAWKPNTPCPQRHNENKIVWHLETRG